VVRNFICDCGHPLNTHGETGCLEVVDANPPPHNLGDKDFCFCQSSPQVIVDAILDKALDRYCAEKDNAPEIHNYYARGYNYAVKSIREALK